MGATEILQDFGIHHGEDAAHRQKAQSGYIEPEPYFEAATAMLHDLVPVVDEVVVPELEQYADRWNPGGFMVFPLGIHDELGSLRLHVWPPNVSRQSDIGPNIHNHAWHLASLIHRGTYSDTLFELEFPENPDLDHETSAQRLYWTHRKGDGQDVLLTDGRVVRPVIKEHRRIVQGDTHTIEAGEYHIPTVDLKDTAVTLVFDSPSFDTTTGVILTSVAPEIARTRRHLNVSDVALARTVILGE